MTDKLNVNTPAKVPTFPFPPRCHHWPEGGRCKADAECWLIAPDGKLNPGGYLCQHHADAIISEYQEKLGEGWNSTPLRFTS